jgi:hypothetical protein
MESIPGLHKRIKIRAQATKGGGIDYSESVPGLLKRLLIGALILCVKNDLYKLLQHIDSHTQLLSLSNILPFPLQPLSADTHTVIYTVLIIWGPG